jgi:O-antigen ligase
MSLLNINVNKTLLILVLLTSALLLSTPNFSIVSAGLLFFMASYYLAKNKQKLTIKKVDKWFIIGATSYFVSFIPVAIIDGSTLRYFDSPLRFLLSIPIYLCIKTKIEQQQLDIASIRKHLEVGLIVGSIGACILAAYQVMALNIPRADGFVFSINFGYLACSMGFLCIAFIKKSRYPALNLLAFICAMIATTLSLTRGAILVIPLLLIVSLYSLYREQLTIKRVSLFFIAFSCICIVAYHGASNIKSRADYTVYEAKAIFAGDTVKATSSGARIELWMSAIEAFKQNPLLGTSYQDREAISQQLYDSGEYTNRVILAPRSHAHSQYFEVIASTGLIGVIALFIYLFLPLYYYAKCFQRNKKNYYALAGGLFTLTIAFCAFTEVLLQANLIATYYAIIQATLIPCATLCSKAGDKYNV